MSFDSSSNLGGGSSNLGGGRSFSNFLNSLLSQNSVDAAPPLPMRRRFGLPLPPSLSNIFGRSSSKRKTVIYPFPEDCESELHEQCLGLVRVCSDDGCTLECETASGPPSISDKCKKAHPCSADMEKFCTIMGDEKQLFKCLLSHKKILSPLCLASEPCLQSENSTECQHGGVGKHIFDRVMERAEGQHGEIHSENAACSCKKHFLGFSGCGSHMTHPFCLPCGENCIRNPFCGPSSTWCEVENSILCPPGGPIKTFEFKLNQIDGNEKYKEKFPTSMLKTIYRSCKPKKNVGLGSWLKDIMDPIATNLEDQLEDTLARAKTIVPKNQTFSATKSEKATENVASAIGNVVKKDGEMFKFAADTMEANKTKVVEPDIVPATELAKTSPAAVAVAGGSTAKTGKSSERESQSTSEVAARTTGGHRTKFITWLWCGIGVAVVAAIIVVYLRQNGSSQWGTRRKQRHSSNEKISRRVGDEFL
jgi:hypothetical protein